MNKFVINGGIPLKGEVDLCGAKNSGFKLMIASLYSDQNSTITGFSKIGDIYSTAEIIKDLGGNIEFDENHQLIVSGKNLINQEISQNIGKLSRASTYFIGPLLYRFGKAILPVPGGCKIGKRPLDRHMEGLKALGVKVEIVNDMYLITADKLIGTNFKFNKNTHGGTDIMIIASVFAKGKTILENAAEEPEIDDLINFLNLMGARIIRTKERTIEIEGVSFFNGANYKVMPDRNEAVTFACASLATKGDIFVKEANPVVLKAFLNKLDEIGGGYEIQKEGIRFFYKNILKSTNIMTQHYPGFMTDWMSIWSVLMTQARGTSIIHETIFENRFAFVNELQKMGANIELFNPIVEDPQKLYNFNLEDDKPIFFHAAKITGQSILRATDQEITDLRAGACLILASLVAEGQSNLFNIEHVDRGYEKLDERLKTLGANITRINE